MKQKKIRLGDYCKITSGGDRPSVFTEKKTKNNIIPVVSNGIDNDGIVGYTNRPTEDSGTITMSARGSCGFVFYRDYAYYPIVRLLSITPNDLSCLDTKYLYYLLKIYPYKAIGSVQLQITIPQLSRHSVFIDEDIKNQRKIAHFLSLLDDKISFNKKINFELESMIKTIYSYWFLQFDFPDYEGKPYKTSGGDMVWNEVLKREIPKNWQVKKLKDLIFLGNDRKYKGLNVKTLDLSVMPSNSISLNELNDSDNFDTNLFVMKKYDILFGSIRPYLKKAGIAPCDGAFAGTVHCFRCYNDYDYNFALETLTSENMFDYACKNSKGSKMPVIGADRILEYPVPYNEEIVRKFNSFDFKKIIVSNITQNQELASLRDFLLPLLMNGQAKFKD